MSQLSCFCPLLHLCWTSNHFFPLMSAQFSSLPLKWATQDWAPTLHRSKKARWEVIIPSLTRQQTKKTGLHCLLCALILTPAWYLISFFSTLVLTENSVLLCPKALLSEEKSYFYYTTEVQYLIFSFKCFHDKRSCYLLNAQSDNEQAGYSPTLLTTLLGMFS